jgi:pimeloyl-ACP methyl ester carboxylesterase
MTATKTLLGLGLLIALAQGLVADPEPATLHDAPPDGLGKTIEVPLDHQAPRKGRASLYYEFGARYDSKKPVVLVIADAQQFHVRRGAMAGVQRHRFGDGLNVVGIVGRGATKPFRDATLDHHGRPDWEKAWRVFNSGQWVEDIDAVRQAVVGERGQVFLYGVSGGALLVHEYLARHGEHAGRAFTAAAVDPFHEGELGLNSDRFWLEIGAHDRTLQATLRDVLRQHADDRPRILMTLQRQNFFIPPEKLQQARADLIRALAAGDDRRYEEARRAYQVDAVHAFFESPEGIPVRVREFEFLYPSGALPRLRGEAVYPNHENTYNFAKPLVALCDAGKIPAPSLDLARLHRLDTEVLIVAGRWDHTVDYRTSIALAACYPRSGLFIADDDHRFGRLEKSGAMTKLIRAFLGSGLSSAEWRGVLKAAAPHRWREP